VLAQEYAAELKQTLRGVVEHPEDALPVVDRERRAAPLVVVGSLERLGRAVESVGSEQSCELEHVAALDGDAGEHHGAIICSVEAFWTLADTELEPPPR
jgi:hypothetical protein